MAVPVAPDQAVIALGVMSTVVAFESGRATSSKMGLMRERVREAMSTASPGHGIATRFLLAQRNSKDASAVDAAALAENATHGDLLFVDMPERFYLCAWKKVLWYRHALRHFPAAGFILIADPDAFIQLNHLSEDLRSVQRLIDRGAASAHVHYGLVLWKAFYNAVSEEPAVDFSGWLCDDSGALRLRRRFERCRDVLRNASATAPERPEWLLPGKGADSAYDAWAEATLQPLKGCKGLQRGTRRALERMEASSGPYPFTSGPLFGLSRPLAELLAAPGGPADEWRRRIERTQPLRMYFSRGFRIPFTLRSAACYPASFDTTHGRWVWELARASGFALDVTLVNTPFMVQHHPWLSFRHGAFSNASLVLHELKNPSSPGWAFAAARGSGPFVPFERGCGPCGAPPAGASRGAQGMGWVTAERGREPNPVSRWRCCGAPDGGCGDWKPPNRRAGAQSAAPRRRGASRTGVKV